MIDSNVESFWLRILRSSREHYLHQNCLKLLEHVEDLQEERDNLLSVKKWFVESKLPI